MHNVVVMCIWGFALCLLQIVFCFNKLPDEHYSSQGHVISRSIVHPSTFNVTKCGANVVKVSSCEFMHDMYAVAVLGRG